MEPRYKFTGQVSKANDDGSIRFNLITRNIDRDGEVLLPMGAKTNNLVKNNIWLWCHNQEAYGGMIRPPIGKMKIDTIEQTTDVWAVDVIFDEKGLDPFAAMVADKHRNGFLNSTSVGFLPITISERPEFDGQKGVTFLEYEILEGSSVPIPSNPNALQVREWSDFVASCKSYGFTDVNLKDAMQSAGWDKYVIDTSLPTGAVQVEIELKKSMPFDEETVIPEIRQRSLFLTDNVKSGRVLSEKNRNLIKDAVSALQSLLEATNNEPEEPEKSNNAEIIKHLTVVYENIQNKEIENEINEIINKL
jgi:hypothetical protein